MCGAAAFVVIVVVLVVALGRATPSRSRIDPSVAPVTADQVRAYLRDAPFGPHAAAAREAKRALVGKAQDAIAKLKRENDLQAAAFLQSLVRHALSSDNPTLHVTASARADMKTKDDPMVTDRGIRIVAPMRDAFTGSRVAAHEEGVLRAFDRAVTAALGSRLVPCEPTQGPEGHPHVEIVCLVVSSGDFYSEKNATPFETKGETIDVRSSLQGLIVDFEIRLSEPGESGYTTLFRGSARPAEREQDYDPFAAFGRDTDRAYAHLLKSAFDGLEAVFRVKLGQP